MTTLSITSLHNPRVKAVVHLRDARDRRRTGLFLIDGPRETARALTAGIEVVEAFVHGDAWREQGGERLLADLERAGAEVLEVTRQVFDRIAYGDRGSGIVAVAKRRERRLEDHAPAADALVAVLEGVEKPGNIGAVSRSADGAGVSAVIVAGTAVDLFNPNAIRASLGTIFTLPVFAATVEEAAAWLKRHEFKVLAARVGAGALHTTEGLYDGRTAIVLGSEAFGLSSMWQEPSVAAVRLPMRGAADSLNVSTTAAVLFYEALRQRGQAASQ